MVRCVSRKCMCIHAPKSLTIKANRAGVRTRPHGVPRRASEGAGDIESLHESRQQMAVFRGREAGKNA